jgi:AcrR family transcriptional regulator
MTQKQRAGQQASRTRPSPLRQRVKEERKTVYRQAISHAAERVFATKGAGGTHMRDIAAEAGVSLGTLYGVIDGKGSLFREIHRSRMREFLDCIREASDAHEETLASHLAVVRQGGRYFLERPDFLRMCCHDGYGWAARVPDTDGVDIWDEATSIPRELFARGIDEGIYAEDDPQLLVRKMLALKQVELTHWVDRGLETSHSSVLDRLEDQFIRAFCVRST